MGVERQEVREVFLGPPEGFSLVLRKKSSASRCRITWNFPRASFPVLLKGMGVVSTSTQTVMPTGMGQADAPVWTDTSGLICMGPREPPRSILPQGKGSLTW